ncbi:unnamed protein product [Brugia timori]|uniref:Ovule protein n=1 Tax=Brugia timori TaxID=42155 RepID=A0A0R3Q887_9BILA|nr:unnamed protein product [Brugia timori]
MSLKKRFSRYFPNNQVRQISSSYCICHVYSIFFSYSKIDITITTRNNKHFQGSQFIRDSQQEFHWMLVSMK